MDFEFSEEHKIFRESIRSFAEKEIAPLVEEAEKSEKFPVEIFPKMGKLGYLGLCYPEEYGGAGADAITECICSEELAKVCLGITSAVFVPSMIGPNEIYLYGSEAQKQDYLIPTIKGEKIPAVAITEPDAGSDVSSIRSTARKEGDRYILNGAKMFITNAPIADYIVVLAYTDKERGVEGMSLFIVDKGTPGLGVSRLEKMGSKSVETGEVVFEDCAIPDKNLIGKEGGAFSRILEGLNRGRVTVAARYVGLAEAAYEAALKYSKERVQFGKPIGKFQSISFKLADMATEIEASKFLVYRAAWLYDKGVKCRKEASMAKLFATEMVQRVTGEAVQIHGGYGYMMEYPVQRYFRDAKVGTIHEGTSEIQRMIIAREIGI